jgi:tetrahydromethanopterin S-methyltransferase subunit F
VAYASQFVGRDDRAYRGKEKIKSRLCSIGGFVNLVAQARHFGGRQWYFICPSMNRRVSVLWKPPGAREFACRQRWARQVAYASQFLGRDDRAHRGKEKIKSRLCSIGGFDPDEWDLPPKPKHMRWKTYNRAVEKFDEYEEILDVSFLGRAAKLLGRK